MCWAVVPPLLVVMSGECGKRATQILYNEKYRTKADRQVYDVFFTTIKLSVCRTNGLSVQVGKLAQVWLLSRFACALALAGLRVCGHEQATTRLTLRADLEHNQRALPEGGSFRAMR